MGAKITGFDEFQKSLDDLVKRIESVSGENEILLSELLTTDFMNDNTQFNSLDEMFEKSGFTIASKEDLENIPDNEWNLFISSNTQFQTWDELLANAAEQWLCKKIGFE